MAGLDTSIPLGIRPVDFGDPNEGRMNALRAQMMQMQMQQGQFNMMKAQRDMQYQDQQRAQAAAAAARDKAAEKKFNALVPNYITAEGTTTYNPRDVEDTTSPTAGLVNAEGIPDNVKSFTEKTPSKIDYQGIAAKAFALEGKYGREFAGKMFELGKKNEEFLKANEENTKKKLDDAYAQVGPLVMQAQTPQDIADWTRRLYSDPVLGPEASKLKTVDKAIQDNMQQFLQNPDQFKAVMGRMITGEKLYEITRRTPDIDKTTGFDTNYRSPTFGVRMFEPPQTAGGKSNLDLDAAYRQQKQDEARAAALETQGDTTGAAAIREQAQARVDALKDQIEKATNIKGGGNELPPLKPADKFKIEQGLNKSYSTATSLLDTLEEAHDALQNVQGSNLAGATGIPGRFLSLPNSTAATAESRMKTLEGKVTALGKASAASTGAIGSIATQEWKILRDMVASLDPNAGDKVYRAALDNVEAQLQGAKNRIRDAYEKAHVDTLKRPEFQQYGALPEPRERGNVTPGANPTAQKPAVNRVQPNTPAGGARVPAGAAGAAPTNAKGWVLHTDANGNKAYVSPDGKSFEEVK